MPTMWKWHVSCDDPLQALAASCWWPYTLSWLLARLAAGHPPPQANFPLGELTCLTTLAEHSCGVTSLAFDRGTLYSGGHDGSTKVARR